MTTKLAECAWEQGQIVKSAMSYDRGEKFLPSVVGNNYDWLRFKRYMGNVGLDFHRRESVGRNSSVVNRDGKRG